MKTYIQSTEHPVTVNWEGSLFVHHSLGMVNREIISELITDKRLELGHIAYEPDQFLPENNSKYHSLLQIHEKPLKDAAVHIRHRWPPDFRKPAAGKFILIQPWEYGSLPLEWVQQINENVDEVWVYTSYLKMCYLRSGISEEKVHIVPCGVDPLHFNSQHEPLSWLKEALKGRFCFLFNGGTTMRKGIDILVNAYLSEFKAHEPVCLVIKDSPVYGKGLAARIKELSCRSDIASIIYTVDNVAHQDLPGLYTACDCYVHPYRAEGYGLPIAEAMACAKPVIVSGVGSCLDFVDPDTGYFIKCTLEKMKERNVSGMPTVDFPFWAVPDMKHLQSLLRYVYHNYHQASEIGELGAKKIRAEHTWKHAAARASERIIAITRSSMESLSQLLAMADNSLQVGDIENAELLFSKALGLYGTNAAVFEGLAMTAYHQKQYGEAFNLFKKANHLMPGNSHILQNWYEVALIVGRANELVNPLQRALEISPRDYELAQLAASLNK